MPWTRLSDTFTDDPNLCMLSRDARLLLIEGRVWANRHGTDGVIPKRMVRRFSDAAPETADELAANGLWIDEGDDWRDRDFLVDQIPAAEIRRQRELQAERQRKHRERKANPDTPASRIPSRRTSRVTDDVSHGAPSHPLPSPPKGDGRGRRDTITRCEAHPTEPALGCRSCIADVKAGNRSRDQIGHLLEATA